MYMYMHISIKVTIIISRSANPCCLLDEVCWCVIVYSFTKVSRRSSLRSKFLLDRRPTLSDPDPEPVAGSLSICGVVGMGAVHCVVPRRWLRKRLIT